MSIKNRLRDIGLNTYLKKKVFNPDLSLEGAKGVAVLFSAETLAHQQLATAFSNKVTEITKEPTYLFGYVHKQLENHVTFGFPHFSLTDIGLFPDFSKHKLSIFMQKSYHVLINLDLSNYPILHYVSEKTQAGNKLAINPRYSALYNIIVKRDSTDTMESLVDKTFDIFEKTLGR
jgi:hypothetical protein